MSDAEIDDLFLEPGPNAVTVVRLVCQRVLEARKRGDPIAEIKALNGQRWGRWSGNNPPAHYIARNVRHMVDHLAVVFPGKKRFRMVKINPSRLPRNHCGTEPDGV